MGFALDDKPQLRWPLDVQQSVHAGRQVVVLSDVQQLAPASAIIPQPLMPIIARFDGTTSIRDIAEEGKAFGVTPELVLELARQLDEMLFIDTPVARARAQEAAKEFAELRIREMAHAGAVYPAQRSALAELIEGFLSQASRGWNGADIQGSVVAMIAPHIDYRRGWNTYAASFDILKQVKKPDVIFLIGTSHQPGRNLFHLTRKSFACPYGVFPTDLEVVEALGSRYGLQRAFASELLHRREHSLELQLPFIGHRYAGDGLPSLVPILVGSFHHCVLRGRSPLEEAEISDFIAALTEQLRTLRAAGKKVLLYGGVDLAHVGLHFGDDTRVSDSSLPEIEQRDNELLEAVLNGDEQRLFSHIAEDGDKRRICGFPSMYTMFAALRQSGVKVQGRCLEYRQAVEPESDCVVTFASAAWRELA